MRLLIDESAGKKLASLLEQAGHDAVFSGEAGAGLRDEEVLSFAERENRILVTADKDFGELVFRMKMRASGVILLRMLTRDPQKRFDMIRDILGKAEGKFIVVSEGHIRIREL